MTDQRFDDRARNAVTGLSAVPPYPSGHQLLAGRVVVVTAAAGTGIGSATARRCLEEGASVVISDWHQRRLGEMAEQLADVTGVAPSMVPCDVTDDTQVQSLIEATVAEHGRLDVLVNNAGLGGEVSLEEMTDEQWSRVLDVTLTGTFRCTRAALRQFRRQFDGQVNGPVGRPVDGQVDGPVDRQGRVGAIVNNASVIGWRAQAGQAHYAAAKAGVMALTRCAAIEAAEIGVRVNAVAPSLALHPFLAKVTTEDLLAELTQREAFGRAAEPWEVANAIVFLASDYASYLTGEVLSVSSQHP
jgi:3-oxoacyl-[acyl-carrier protein] reductase